MAFRMAGLKRTKSGSYTSRKAIPKDVQDDYQAIYKKRYEEWFHALATCSLSTAKRLHSEWESEIERAIIETLRAKRRGDGHGLTNCDDSVNHHRVAAAARSLAPGRLIPRSIVASVAAMSSAITLLRMATGLRS